MTSVGLTDRKPSRSGAIQINLVSITIYIILIVGAYVAWKGLPLWWEYEDIRHMMGEVAITAARHSDAELRDKVWRLMRDNFNTELPIENVRVWRTTSSGSMTGNATTSVVIEVEYERVIKHPWGKETVLVFRPRVKRLVL